MLKKLVYSLLAVLLFFVFLLAFLPTFISSPFGNALINRLFAKKGGISLEAKKISISWFGSQEIEDIKVNMASKGCTFKCTTLNASASLLKIIFLNRIDTLNVIDPTFKFYDEEKPYTSLKTASLIPSSPAFFSLPIPKAIPQGDILVRNGYIFLQGLEEMALKQLHASFHIDKNLTLSASASVISKEKTGKLDIKAKMETYEKSNIIDVDLSNIPLDAVDALIDKFQLRAPITLTSLLGEETSLKLHSDLVKGIGNITFLLASPKASLDVEALIHNEVASLKKPLSFKLQLDKNLSYTLSSLTNFDFPEQAELVAQVDSAQIPLKNPLQQASPIQLNAIIKAYAPLFSFKEKKINEFSFNSSLSSQDLAKALKLTLSIEGSIENKDCKIDLNSAVNEIFTPLRNGQLSLKTINFPLNAIDSRLEEALGTTLNFSLEASKTNDTQITIKVESPYIFVEDVVLGGTKTIELQKPALIKFRAPPLETSFTAQLESLAFICEQELSKVQGSTSFNFKDLILRGFPLGEASCNLKINTLQDILINLQSKLLALKANVGIDKKLFFLKSPLEMQGSLDQPFIKKQIPSFAATLQNPLVFNAQLMPFSFSLDGQNNVNLEAKAKILPFTLLASDQLSVITIQGIDASLLFNPYVQKASFNAHSSIGENVGALGKVDASFSIIDWQKKSGASQLSIEFTHFPTKILEILSNQEGLHQFLANTLNGSIKGKSSQNEDGLSLNLKSQTIAFDTELVIGNGFLNLKKASKLQLHLTPSSFKALDNILHSNKASSKPFLLRENSDLSLTVNKLQVPLKRENISGLIREYEFIFNRKDLLIDALIECPHLAFLDPLKKQEVIFEALKIETKKDNKELPITLKMKSDILTFTSSQHSKEGKIDLSLESAFPFKEDNNFSLEGIKTRLHLNLDYIPTMALDFFARIAGAPNTPFNDLFGPVINARLFYDINDLNGPFEININSKDTKAYLVGSLRKGVLYLKEPLVAQVSISEQISRPFFNKFNPLGIQYLETSHPITISIDPKGFALPLFPYVPSAFNMNFARAEFGKVYCTTDGTLNTTLGLLRFNIEDTEKLPLWFTPIDLSAKNGLISVSRMDFLVADSMQLAFWGDVNLVEGNVNMILGLTAQALSQAFGLNNLHEDYVLQIPVKGPFDHIEINTKKATSKIAALLAIEQGGSLVEKHGGSKGAIIGGFLKELSKLPDSDNIAPPPKKPFPWESKLKTSQNEELKAKKKKAIKSSDSPIKQFLKVFF